MRVVYHSFEGRFSDNPRALYEALTVRGEDVEHVWLADERHRAGFPPGVELVPYGGSACIQALEAADVVVANTHTDLVWTKREGATYLQTWHGTPLKRIHHDVLWAPAGRLERLSRDVEKWDLLVSQNRFSTGALRGAFRYDGEVLETGYPRNDALQAADRDEVRARRPASASVKAGCTQAASRGRSAGPSSHRASAAPLVATTSPGSRPCIAASAGSAASSDG